MFLKIKYNYICKYLLILVLELNFWPVLYILWYAYYPLYLFILFWIKIFDVFKSYFSGLETIHSIIIFFNSCVPFLKYFRKSYLTVDRNNTVYPKPWYTMDSSLLDVYAGHCTWSSYGEYDRPAFTGLPAGLAWWLFYSICGWVFAIALQHISLQQSKFSLCIILLFALSHNTFIEVMQTIYSLKPKSSCEIYEISERLTINAMNFKQEALLAQLKISKILS